PRLAGEGLVVAGEAAGRCLAAGLCVEGVTLAIGSGMYAGRAAAAAVAAGDTSARGLAGYRKLLAGSFVLADHRRLRNVPALMLSDRVQQRYPGMVCDLVQGLFTVDNPRPKPGLRRLLRRSARAQRVRRRDLVRDGLAGLRAFG